jgi:amino acid adenylation domain-containing protein
VNISSSNRSTLRESLRTKLLGEKPGKVAWLDVKDSDIPSDDAPGWVRSVMPIDPETSETVRTVAESAGITAAAVWFAATRIVTARYAKRNSGSHIGLAFNARKTPVPVFSGATPSVHALILDSEGWLARCRDVPLAMPLVCISIANWLSQTEPAPSSQLAVDIDLRENDVIVSAMCRNDIFSPAMLDQFVAQITFVAGQIDVIAGEAPERVDALSPSQRRHALDLASSDEVGCEPVLIHQLFEGQVEKTPDACALVFENESLTYRELDRRANRVAHHLVSRGMQAGDLVALLFERGPSMVVGMFAVLKAGGAYVPLDKSYPSARIRAMIANSAPRAILIDDRQHSSLLDFEGFIVDLDALAERESHGPGENIETHEHGLTPENLAYVMYTSGSTGEPKGVAMPHAGLVDLIGWQQRHLDPHSAKRTLQFASFGFDVAFAEIAGTLCSGGTLFMVDEWTRRDACALLKFLVENAIERMFVPPMVLQNLAVAFERSDACLRLRDVIVAGEQLRITPELRTFFEALDLCRLHNHYGPTETHLTTTLTLPRDPAQWPSLPSIGRPIANARVYILDEHMNLAPPGVWGEVYVGGAVVARGYLNRPDLTAKRFHEDTIAGEKGGRMYMTGDMGRYLADGTIGFLGRNDFQVKLRGFRIELGDIESALVSIDGIREAVAIVHAEPGRDARLVAYFTADSPLDSEFVRHRLSEALPGFMLPGVLVELPRLPLTVTGKVDRGALPSPGASQRGKTYAAPRTETERTLCRIWQDLLGVESIGIADNFFQMGGHSLMLLSMVASIRETLRTEVSVRVVFETSDLQGLAAYIDVVTGDRVGASPPREMEEIVI